jgi:hypothetical protein
VEAVTVEAVAVEVAVVEVAAAVEAGGNHDYFKTGFR